jgi:hypothetical protein
MWSRLLMDRQSIQLRESHDDPFSSMSDDGTLLCLHMGSINTTLVSD